MCVDSLGKLCKAGQQSKDKDISLWSWTLRLSSIIFQVEVATWVTGHCSDTLKLEVIV